MSRVSMRDAGGLRRVALGAAVALLALAGALVVSVAVAGAAKSTERSKTVTLPADDHVEYGVSCKGNKRVSGVGFQSRITANGGIGITSALAPTGKTEVLARGSEVGRADPAEHTAYAYCLGKLKQRIKVATEPTVNRGIAVATAKCKGKRNRAIGGGFFAAPFGGGNGELAGVVLQSRRKSKSSWKVAYYNADSSDNGEFTAYAICSKLEVSERVATATADVADGGSAKAKCKRKETAVSGGFAAVEAVGDNDGNFALPLSSSRVDKRTWRTIATPNQSVPDQFKSYAYCAKKL